MKKNHERSHQKTKLHFFWFQNEGFFPMAFFFPRNIPGAAKDSPTWGFFDMKTEVEWMIRFFSFLMIINITKSYDMYVYIYMKSIQNVYEIHVNIHLETISTIINIHNYLLSISSMNQLPLTKISFTSVQTLQAQSESPQVGFLPKKTTTTVISSKISAQATSSRGFASPSAVLLKHHPKENRKEPRHEYLPMVLETQEFSCTTLAKIYLWSIAQRKRLAEISIQVCHHPSQSNNFHAKTVLAFCFCFV